MPCPHVNTCKLFPLLEGSLLGTWKSLYCENDDRYEDCERFKLASQGVEAPLTLLPNGVNVEALAPKK